MAITYQRNTWETGKVITAKALNDIETGIVNIVEKLNGMDGEVTSQTLTARGDATIGGDVAVTGNATFSGSVEINSATTLKGATIINGVTTINNNVTVGADQHIILLESASESPNENNYVVTKGYVDEKVTAINNAITDINQTSITSTNTGITSTGHIGDELSITLNPATTSALGGIKVGQNLTINAETGKLDATDTTYLVASANADGLMSSAHFKKLNGLSIKIDENNTSSTSENGIIDISGHVLTSHQDISSKANLDSPRFSGVVNFGNQISIDTNNNKITINQTDITESQINALYNLPSIPPLSSDNPDGTYVLQATKNTPEGATPVITYSWVQVPEQESGGEGS